MGVRGRLAPSPTGYLHIGNAWAFLIAWLAVRAEGGSLVLRMEDIDPDRSRREFELGIVEDLKWLGLDWDEGPDSGGAFGPYRQSDRLGYYGQVLDEFIRSGKVYPCYCTRKELRSMASAPHLGEHVPVYPGTCRNLDAAGQRHREASGRAPAQRMRCGEKPRTFVDAVYGRQRYAPAEWGGDFPVRRSDGVFAYQFAVVLDDAAMQVNQVVRGRDILHCTPRQLVIYEAIGAEPPAYIHVPLVLDAEGERLAKRHGHFELRRLREAGVAPQALVGFLGWKAGLLETCVPCRPELLAARFRKENLPHEDIRLDHDILSLLAGISEQGSLA
ncbi:tRNA glutamyl-Q(34) synthetase GluQRS [Oleidesulfovibrio alaskensis]|uniref:tRNA glutamyl-Q(34) synthetase GluQRS n=1 Tax=Oleidesulfovibrio alaskensis TaxID=58180 RepID=UPI00042492A5|nr:tRNA glutamyl-Q(34) synthetase GluQRS [Oleidesulfovibrio alaskensis]